MKSHVFGIVCGWFVNILKNLQALKIVKEKFFVTFDMKDLNKVSYYVGLKFWRIEDYR
jgi:hypothetical protein